MFYLSSFGDELFKTENFDVSVIRSIERSSIQCAHADWVGPDMVETKKEKTKKISRQDNEDYQYKFDNIYYFRKEKTVPELATSLETLPWTWQRYFRYSMLKCMSSLSFLHFPMGKY
jgi:hypothetical protein